MDAFEQLVGMLLEHDGYWVRPNFKVELTKEEKRLIGRPSSPRWELDLVAYKGGRNEIRVVECKSYLDLLGVLASAFTEASPAASDRFKLFNDTTLREVVFGRLAAQLVAAGACAPGPTITLCLAAGRIARPDDRTLLHSRFTSEGWLLWDDEWLYGKLKRLSRAGYQNDVAAVVAKLLLRPRLAPPPANEDAG